MYNNSKKNVKSEIQRLKLPSAQTKADQLGQNSVSKNNGGGKGNSIFNKKFTKELLNKFFPE